MRVLARNVVLCGVLAGLLAASAALERPPIEAEAKGPLVPGFDRGAVARIEIRGKDGASVTLDRRGDGGWGLVERGGFSAAPYPVLALLTNVENLSRADRLAAEVSAHELFGVDEAGTRITLYDAALRPLVALVQGASSGMVQGSNVRLADRADVYRAPSFQPASAQPASWIDTGLLPFQAGDVTAMTVSHDSGRVLVDLRSDGNAWVVPGGGGGGGEPTRAPRITVERILEQASSIVFSDLVEGEVDPEHGFGTPPRTMVEVELEDGGRSALWIGDPVPPADGGAVAYYYTTNPGWQPRRLATLAAPLAERLIASIEDLAAAVGR